MHIADFLEQAAPTPNRALDFDTLRAKAHRPRWYKRRWIWVTGLIALGGAAVPAGITLSPASGPGARVTTVRPRPERTDTPSGPTIAVAPPGGATVDSVSAASESVPSEGDGTSASTPSSTPAAIPRQSPSDGSDECVLQGGEAGIDTPGAGGAGIGNFPQCGYTARSAAGYIANGSWQMSVTDPDGSVHTYGPGNNSGLNDGTGPTCGNLDIVQPGDRVHVILYTGAENAADVYYVKVGPSYHC